MENKKKQNNLSSHFDNLSNFFKQKKYQEVINYYHEYLVTKPSKEILKHIAYSYLKLKKYKQAIYSSKELIESEFRKSLEEKAHIYLWMTYAYINLCYLGEKENNTEEFSKNLEQAKENLNNFAKKFKEKFKGEKELLKNDFYCNYKKDIEFLENDLSKRNQIQSYDSISSLFKEKEEREEEKRLIL